MEQLRRSRWWLLWLGLAAAVVVAAFGWLLWRGPAWVYRGAWPRLTAAEQVTATGQFRIALIQFAGALGAVVALAYTARTYRLAHRGQLTERFSKALERLGSDEPYVRLGGVHALAHVLRDSADHHRDVVEVLVAFVRQRAPRVASPTGVRSHGADTRSGVLLVTSDQALPAEPAPDVQAALTALGHHPRRLEARVMLNLGDLHLARAVLNRADLTDASLGGANLTRAWLTGANLTRAWLAEANLTDAWLEGADLTGASLDGANLTDAWLTGADLTRAQLPAANLTRAQLPGANLTRAVLNRADLTDTWLGGANLTRARLEGANLTAVQLHEADLTDAWLEGANLTGAQLPEANLTDASLAGADLTRAELPMANLTRAQLPGANLTLAVLNRADLNDASLGRANLTRARLGGANLTRAWLGGADLTGAHDLTQAQVEAALGDAATRLPTELERPAWWTADQEAVADASPASGPAPGARRPRPPSTLDNIIAFVVGGIVVGDQDCGASRCRYPSQGSWQGTHDSLRARSPRAGLSERRRTLHPC